MSARFPERKISRRGFARSVAAGGAAAALGCAGLRQGARTRRPNILLIIDDQHSPRALGCTGETPALTPNLDRLAASSVRFTNGYCNSPVCAPTRHTLYTGLYPSEHGVLHNDFPMRDDVPTVIALLNEAGYTTASIGKMHNAPYHHRRDFQYVMHHEFYDTAGGISHYYPFLCRHLAERGIAPKSWSHPRPGKKSWVDAVETIAFNADWIPEDLTAERWITEESLRFIRDQKARRPDTPFFLHASYFPPHHPYGPIPKYARLYDPADMGLPPNFDQTKLNAWWRPGKNGREPLTERDGQYMRAHYFAFCTQLDAEVGRLLDGLEALGEADNTIVIFVSDHGDMIGEHGRFYKGVMYEGAARVPFLVRWPGVGRARQEASLVMHADLAPTILRAAGAAVPSNLPGRDLRPLLEDKGRWTERAIYSEYFAAPASHLMLRRGAFKLFGTAPYGQWPDLEYHLFDVEADPWELEDLAGIPDCSRELNDMKDELLAIWRGQRRFLPAELPPVMPRSQYRIDWPSDPWKPVYPS